MSLLDFLRHPVEYPPVDRRLSQLLKTFGWFCLVQFAGLTGTVLFVLLWEVNLPMRDALDDNSAWGILIAVLFAPLLEEAMFRLPLKRTRTTLLIAFGIALFGIVSAVCGVPALRSAERLPMRLGITILLLPPVWFAVRRFAWRIRYSRYFYLLAVLFALAHLLNIEFSALQLAFPVVCFLMWYVAEKFVSGALYSFTRLRHGFVAACCLHALNNAIPCVVAMIAEGFFGA